MTIAEVRPGEFVETDPVEEPGGACFRPGAEYGPFRDFLLSHLRDAARGDDEVAEFVLREMEVTWGGNLENAIVDALEHFPRRKTHDLRRWLHESRKTRVYAYVDVGSRDLSYGLMLTTGRPSDKVVAHKRLGSYELHEESGRYQEFSDALAEIEQNFEPAPRSVRDGGSLYLTAEMEGESKEAERKRERKLARLFDDIPLVEVNDEDDYGQVLAAIGLTPDEGKWTKPGLYDFRDFPPEFASTMDDYIREVMREEAEQAFEMIWQEDWEDACVELLEKE